MSEWLTQEDVARRLDVPLSKVRPVVAALSRLGDIKTTVNPKDNRFVLIHEESLTILRKALGVEHSKRVF